MKLKSLLGVSLFLLTLPACVSEQDTGTTGKPVYVNFTGTKDNYLSRVDGSSWSNNDSIGVFMMKSGDKTLLANNKPYYTPHGNGSFATATTPLTYPDQNPEVDFVAYYPYQSTITGLGNVVLNVEDQTNRQKLDFAYSNNLKKKTKESGNLMLGFKHLMTRLIFNFESTGSLDGLKTDILGLKTKATFHLGDSVLTLDEASTKEIPVVLGMNGRSAEAIVIPQTLTGKVKVRITLNGKSAVVSTNINELKPGFSYTQVFNIPSDGNSAIAVEKASYREWLETPFISKATLSDPDIKYINHDYTDPETGKTVRNYSLLYSKKNRFAYWVAYPLCAYYGTKQVDRSENAWQYDPLLSNDWQPNMYRGINNYDRGHQLPSQDRRRDRKMNASTFYYSNMTPQIGQEFNQGIWRNLEQRIHDSYTSDQRDTVYIVTGAMPPAAGEPVKYAYDNDGERIVVPTAYFKAVVRLKKGEYTGIAFYLKHQPYSDHSAFMDYAISISELEKKTGFTFFPNVPTSVKQNMNKNLW